MAINSTIEWTSATWNPLTGCAKISPGCKNCYAEKISLRLKAMNQPNYRNGFKPTPHEHMLELPLHWKKPRVVFVNSMSDLFHEDVPLDFILKVFDTMQKASWHTFQVLTKRSERLREINALLPWSSNIWMGVSVENQSFTSRIDDLRRTTAFIKFVSFEPLLGLFCHLDIKDINWVIVGGESGPVSRPMKSEWVIEIRDRCQELGVPFFFKQWGGRNKKQNGRELEGQKWEEKPPLRIEPAHQQRLIAF